MNVDAQKKGRRTLMLLAVVFLGPMAIAMTLYFADFRFRPEGTVEHGSLYRPARPMADVAMVQADPGHAAVRLHGKWTLLHIEPGKCGEKCRQALVATRQVRRALGRDLERVQRAIVPTAQPVDMGFLAAEHPGIGVVTDSAVATRIVTIAGGAAEGEIFLVDPLGNLLMRYPAGTAMSGIHADLQRLLKISTIG